MIRFRPHPAPMALALDDTAWVDDSGAVEFRKDIYGHDGELQVASVK